MQSKRITATLATLVALSSFVAAGQIASAAGLDGMRQHARICSPLTAVRKARAMGLRGPEIRDMSPRRVVVSGRGGQGKNRVVFANVPGCPLLRR